MPPPDPVPTPQQVPRQGRHPLRFAAYALIVLTGVAMIALLGYGLISRAPDTGIDDSLTAGHAARAPGFQLDVLQRGDLDAPLTSALTAPLRDGRIALGELRGVPVVLNFWASWCVPCREEASLLQRSWERDARPRGVLMLGLDMQDTDEDARAFMRDFHVSYLNIRDPTNDTSRRYGATGIPETFFISTRGQIVGHVIGVVTPEQLSAGITAAKTGRVTAATLGGAQRRAR